MVYILQPGEFSQCNLQCLLVFSQSLSNCCCHNLMPRTDCMVLHCMLIFPWPFSSHDDLTLEKPLETAMLVSLSGARCIMTNQWYCTLAENADKLTLTMKGEYLHQQFLQSAALHSSFYLLFCCIFFIIFFFVVKIKWFMSLLLVLLFFLAFHIRGTCVKPYLA